MGAIGNLIPLVILFACVGAFGYIGYQMYLYTHDMADRGKKSMEKRNISFSKDGGLKVGVKGISTEAYEDKTQNILSKTWSLGTERKASPNPTSRSSSVAGTAGTKSRA